MSQQESADTASACVVIRIDVGGYVTQLNMPALTALGYGKEELLGKHYGHFLVLSPASNKPIDQNLHNPVRSCMATGQAELAVYGLLRTAHGRARPVEICIAPVYRAGEIAEVILIIEAEDLRGIA